MQFILTKKHSILAVRIILAAFLYILPVGSVYAQCNSTDTVCPKISAKAECAFICDTPAELRLTQRQWLWGIGHVSLLDTYLSPLTYNGVNFLVLHQTERLARRLGKRLTLHSLYLGHFDYSHSPTDDGKDFDGELTAAGSLLYNFRPAPAWRLGIGGTMEMSGGFTYNTRGSNNPAQGRIGISLSASGLAEYRFRFFGQFATARLEADAQMAGVQFSPQFGQSYYEIFSLGHTDGIVHFTHPGNCPSVRLQALVTLPIKSAHLTLGYLADVRQSKLGNLKRHAWRNNFMIGFTRRLRIVH